MCFVLLLALWTTHVSADNLALLSGTLRTYQVGGCQTETVGLSCPPGTVISVELARYGTAPTAARSLCPGAPMALHQQPCHLPSAMQYSLLQTVVEGCQKKRQCKFQGAPKAPAVDPCPGLTKFVEVAYKCRPYEFRSKVACENEVVQLKCHPNSRVAVYSASYGRTEYESVQCPQTQGVPEETCLVPYGTETVMSICHGKRQCTLSADSSTFGNPCKKESRTYLKVVYTCVPRKVLKENYEERPEADEELPESDSPDFESYDGLDDTLYDVFSPSPNLGRSNSSGPASPLPPSSTPPSHVLAHNLTGNKERVYLYVIVSVGGGVLCLLLVVTGRLLWQRHLTAASRPQPKYDPNASITLAGTTSLSPDGYLDNISEVEADVDLTASTTPVTIVHSPPNRSTGNVVRYQSGGSKAGASQPCHYYYG